MARERKPKRTGELPEDDGRTIASMNVEGMPWYAPGPLDEAPPRESAPEPMSAEDRRHYILGALLAALAIAAVFGVVFFLFILFCTKIWFR